MAYTYGSDLRDDALIAEALMRMGTGRRSSRRGEAHRRAAEQRELVQHPEHRVRPDGRSPLRRKEPAEQGHALQPHRERQRPRSASAKRPSHGMTCRCPMGRRALASTNKGKNLLYVRLVRTGTPLAGEERAVAQALVLDVRYQLMDGRYDRSRRGRTGHRLHGRGHHRASRACAASYQQLALTQVFPSGWEIRNTPLEGTESATPDQLLHLPGHPRRPCVMTYFDLLGRPDSHLSRDS